MSTELKRKKSREWTLKFLFQQEFLEPFSNPSFLSLNFELQKFFYSFQKSNPESEKNTHFNQIKKHSKNTLPLFKPSYFSNQYTKSLVKGIYKNKEKIDQTIKSLSHNWSFERILLIDLNILRIAIYEIYFGNIPPKVAINEALNISKKYSTKDSSSFINALLDKALKEQNIKEKKA